MALYTLYREPVNTAAYSTLVPAVDGKIIGVVALLVTTSATATLTMCSYNTATDTTTELTGDMIVAAGTDVSIEGDMDHAPLETLEGESLELVLSAGDAQGYIVYYLR